MIARRTYASGGGIHIKPENRGKFTAFAKSHGMSVQDAASHVMANKNKYTPAIIKRANFAKNAAGWKKADGGEIGNNDASSHRPISMQDIGRLRRTGSLEGWEGSLNEDGSTTLRRQDTFGKYFKDPIAKQATSIYPQLNRTSMAEAPLDMGARKEVSRFMELTPEIENTTYGELNWSRLPGMASNQASTQGGILEFDYRQNAPDVDISSLTPLDVNTNIPLQPSRRKGLPSVLYTPDSMKTSEYINALRMQTRNTNRYNAHVDVLNAMKNRYNKGLSQ